MAASETELVSYRVTLKDKELTAPAARMAQLFPERYSEVPGVFTFRGGPTRTGGAWGTCPMKERKLELAWTAHTGRSPPPWHGGAGWTGQMWWYDSYSVGRMRSFIPASTMTNFFSPPVFR